MRRIPTLVLVALSTLSAAAPLAAQRQRYSMDPGWRFALGDVAGAEAPAFDDRPWRALDLPHDWSIELTPRQDAPGGGTVGYFPTGIGWYRKEFRVPGDLRGRVVELEFDGVYMNSDVWLNGHSLGHRPFGYITFAYDVTSHLLPGVNVVAVRVDNSKQPNSRWYSGSGIYRHVLLTVTDPLRVARWGTYVTTPRADSASAEVRVRTRLANGRSAPTSGMLRLQVLDPTGREVVAVQAPFTAAQGAGAELDQHLQVSAPRLWSPGSPSLYRLRSTLLVGGRVVDTTSTTFGIRTIAYDRDRGFLLNGRRVKMDGVNLHHDGGAMGAAVPERVWERRLEVLKSMGANAIRTSHNPPAPEFLDLCDRLGFLVMAEAFDEWTIGKVKEGYHNYFAEWSERDLTDFVRRDRNHPSIVLWSAGNEIGEQTTPDGPQVLRRLVDILHREDPTRPVTTGNDQIYADGHPATLEFLTAEDVVGYNYVDRWHERRELFAEPDRHAHPDWKMIGTESSSAITVFGGSYSLGTDPKIVRPNYTTGMLRAERLWKWVSLHDYFAGDFMWTGIDYLGETRWPGKGAGSGPVDITGYPKDSYYLYQSFWLDPPTGDSAAGAASGAAATDAAPAARVTPSVPVAGTPVLHLFPHWNWPGREGQIIPVLAYTNCTAVELFLNGRSLGEKRLEFPAQGASGGWNSYARPQVNPTTDDLHLSWDVPYEPGVLKAVGKRDGKELCQAEVRTAGAPVAIRLQPDRAAVTTARGDVAQVFFEVVDSTGTVVPTANHVVSFAVTGGRLLALDNADLRDHDPYQTDHRHAFNGRGLAILRATQVGVLRLTATAGGLRAASMGLAVSPGAGPTQIPAARCTTDRDVGRGGVDRDEVVRQTGDRIAGTLPRSDRGGRRRRCGRERGGHGRQCQVHGYRDGLRRLLRVGGVDREVLERRRPLSRVGYRRGVRAERPGDASAHVAVVGDAGLVRRERRRRRQPPTPANKPILYFSAASIKFAPRCPGQFAHAY